MLHPCVRWLGMGLVALGGYASAARADDPPPLDPPAVEGARNNNDDSSVALLQDDNRPVRPLAEGPLHEAFLSPAKDAEPEHIEKPPPPEITERPGVDPPSPDAKWISGYWQWDAG